MGESRKMLMSGIFLAASLFTGGCFRPDEPAALVGERFDEWFGGTEGAGQVCTRSEQVFAAGCGHAG